MHHHSPLTIIFCTLVTILAIGTVGFKLLEDWTWAQSFYFAVSTASTVGYGDLVPSTDATRVFVSFYIILAVVCFFIGVGLLTNRMGDEPYHNHE